MKLSKNDAYSPNQVLGTMIMAVLCILVFCGKTLWVPASRIENLHLRSVVLAMTDSAAFYASATGLDRYIPVVRTSFLSFTGLSTHNSWDTRYFNRRTGSDFELAGASDVHIVAGESAVGDTTGVDTVAAEIRVSEPEEGVLPPSAALTDADPTDAIVPVFFNPEANFQAGTPVHSSENPLRVFMFGDSQVFSLGSGLSRLAGKDSPVSVDFLAIHSSGFIRGDYYNWPLKLADTFREKPSEAAVLMLGMNDYQSFWNDDNEIMKKGTPEWEEAYKDKCRSIIDIALTFVPRVYWVGMPAVKNRSYDASLAYIDSVQNSLAAEYSPDILTRLSLRDTFPGAQKEYTDTVAVAEGKTLKVMSDDGTHFTVEGGQYVMKPFFDRLSRDYLFSTAPVANMP